MIICNYTIHRISLYQYTVNVTVKISFQFAFTAETRWSFTPHHLTGGLMTPVAWSTSRNWLSSCPSIPRRKTLWFMIRFWFVLGIQCVVLFCFQQKICGKKSTCDMCQKAKEKGNTCDSCIAMLSPQCMSVNAKHELRYSGGPELEKNTLCGICALKCHEHIMEMSSQVLRDLNAVPTLDFAAALRRKRILVGSAGEVDQRMASGETGKRSVLIAFPCFLRYSIVVSAKKLAFGSLQRVSHETFWSENLATTGPKSVSTEAWLAMALSLVTPGRSRIQHIEMSTSERPVTGVKCRDTWLFWQPSLNDPGLTSQLMGHREWSFDSPCSGPIQSSFCLFSFSLRFSLHVCHPVILIWPCHSICFHCFLAVDKDLKCF